MGKVYLYLLRRNRKDSKIIGIMTSESPVLPTRLTDLDLLGLHVQERMKLKKIIDEHRLDWDVWMESVENYEELRKSLANRHIIAATSANTPLLDMGTAIPKTTLIKLNKNKIMTRRVANS